MGKKDRDRKVKGHHGSKSDLKGKDKMKLKGGQTKKRRGAKPAEVRPKAKTMLTTSYTSKHRILLVGEGDFSFARGLARHCAGVGAHITATSFDSESQVLNKYPQARDIIQELRTQYHVTVRHGIDATKLTHHFAPSIASSSSSSTSSTASSSGPFDRIVFNFPHTGLQRVHLNRALVKQFFESAAPLVSVPNGEIHVTIQNGPPYSRWGIEQLGAEARCHLVDVRRFLPASFPGYRHQTTEPDAKPLEATSCLTFVFFPTPEARTAAISSSSSSFLSTSSSSGDSVLQLLIERDKQKGDAKHSHASEEDGDEKETKEDEEDATNEQEEDEMDEEGEAQESGEAETEVSEDGEEKRKDDDGEKKRRKHHKKKKKATALQPKLRSEEEDDEDMEGVSAPPAPASELEDLKRKLMSGERLAPNAVTQQPDTTPQQSKPDVSSRSTPKNQEKEKGRKEKKQPEFKDKHANNASKQHGHVGKSAKPANVLDKRGPQLAAAADLKNKLSLIRQGMYLPASS